MKTDKDCWVFSIDLGIYSSSRFHYIQPGLYFNGSLFISTCPPGCEYVHNTFIYTLCADSQPSDSLLFCPLVYRICCVLFLDFFTSRVLSGPGPLNSAKAKASTLRPLDSLDYPYQPLYHCDPPAGCSYISLVERSSCPLHKAYPQVQVRHILP